MSLQGAHTHPKQSTLPVTRFNTYTHRSVIFQQVGKVEHIKFSPTDKIPSEGKKEGRREEEE